VSKCKMPYFLKWFHIFLTYQDEKCGHSDLDGFYIKVSGRTEKRNTRGAV
jgi:hypothetical protein